MYEIQTAEIQTMYAKIETKQNWQVSEIQTVWKREEIKLSEIQTCLDFRHSLYMSHNLIGPIYSGYGPFHTEECFRNSFFSGRLRES